MTTFQNSGIGELRFLMGPNDAQWKEHLSELAEFRKEHSTATFQLSTAKQPLGS
jgi:hypothetical protein